MSDGRDGFSHMRKEHWIDLGKIIAVLTAFTVLCLVIGKVYFDMWIDVFYPYAGGGVVLALVRIGRRRRELMRETS